MLGSTLGPRVSHQYCHHAKCLLVLVAAAGACAVCYTAAVCCAPHTPVLMVLPCALWLQGRHRHLQLAVAQCELCMAVGNGMEVLGKLMHRSGSCPQHSNVLSAASPGQPCRAPPWMATGCPPNAPPAAPSQAPSQSSTFSTSASVQGHAQHGYGLARCASSTVLALLTPDTVSCPGAAAEGRLTLGSRMLCSCSLDTPLGR